VSVAKMRETLEAIERMAQWGGSDFGNPAIRGLLDTLTAIRNAALSAMAEPKHNFERFATPGEAQEAFFRLCHGRHSCGPHCWYHPADLNEACSFRWLYDTKPHDWSDVTKGGKP